jgi:hypothetical protein
MELQSTWIARVLSGRLSLPGEDQMMADVKLLYEELEASSDHPKSYTHMIGMKQVKGLAVLVRKFQLWKFCTRVVAIRNSMVDMIRSDPLLMCWW